VKDCVAFGGILAVSIAVGWAISPVAGVEAGFGVGALAGILGVALYSG
jgi:hypothetical protein